MQLYVHIYLDNINNGVKSEELREPLLKGDVHYLSSKNMA